MRMIFFISMNSGYRNGFWSSERKILECNLMEFIVG